MAGLMLNDTDIIRLAETVNRQQAAGYAPVGGLIIGSGVYFQYMVEGDNGGVAYSIVLTQSDVAFQEEANAHAGSGLGTCQFINGWFMQAFGAEASGGAATVAWGDITGKPSTFAPIIGTTATTAMAGNKTLANIGGVVPTSGLPAASTTAAGIIQIGTGATQAMAGNTALTAIGGTLSVAKGGTGATTAAAAWTALGGGAVGKLAALPKAAATPDLAADADLPTTVAKVNDLLAALRAAGYLTA